MPARGSDVLAAVAEARWRLNELGHRLRTRPDVESVNSGVVLLPSRGSNSIPLSIYLEAVVGNGEPLVWDVDIGWHDDWWISTQVTYSVGDDIETLRRLPERRAKTAEVFVHQLSKSVTELIATAGEIDIESYAVRARRA